MWVQNSGPIPNTHIHTQTSAGLLSRTTVRGITGSTKIINIQGGGRVYFLPCILFIRQGEQGKEQGTLKSRHITIKSRHVTLKFRHITINVRHSTIHF